MAQSDDAPVPTPRPAHGEPAARDGGLIAAAALYEARARQVDRTARAVARAGRHEAATRRYVHEVEVPARNLPAGRPADAGRLAVTADDGSGASGVRVVWHPCAGPPVTVYEADHAGAQVHRFVTGPWVAYLEAAAATGSAAATDDAGGPRG